MDDLAALFDADRENTENRPQDDDSPLSSSPGKKKSPSNRSSHDSKHETQQDQVLARPRIHRPLHADARHRAPLSQTPAEASIDTKLGIRMFNRKLSSVDLMDLISTHPFHSPAAISAMTLAALNRLLVDPAAVVSDATVTGKTNLVTVGIIFSNSGTRVSNNGRAFSVLSIGNLATGPALSVFLFGDAYSRHCTSCAPGTVVALMTPKLIPPKEGSSDGTISLSVNATQQLVPVALASHYGTCKGKARVKQSDGRWISNGVCKHFVDTSLSPYCPVHRKQANLKTGKVDKNRKRTLVQKVKGRSAMNAGWSQRTVTPVAAASLTSKKNRTLTMSTPQGPVVSYVPSRSALPNMQSNAPAGSSHSSTKASMNMRNQQTTLPTLRVRRPPVKSLTSFSRPAAKAGRPVRQAVASSKTISAANEHIAKDWLGDMTKKPKPVKRRAINIDTVAFDGSVPIPQPPKHYRSDPATPLSHRMAASHSSREEEKKLSVLHFQKLLAERSQSSTWNGKPLMGNDSTNPKTSSFTAKTKSNLKESLYGSLGDVALDKVMSAESRFSNEANAEAYAKSRRLVSELEKQEYKTTNVAARKEEGSTSGLSRLWTCKSCGRTTSLKPNLCIRRKHRVVSKFKVQKTATLEEKRLIIGTKSVEDGGLTLGTGLEWDQRRGSAYR